MKSGWVGFANDRTYAHCSFEHLTFSLCRVLRKLKDPVGAVCNRTGFVRKLPN